MGRPRKHPDEAARRNHQNQQRKTARANAPAEFICIDGEGFGDGAQHTYAMLGCGDDHIHNPAGIGWQEAFTFLYGVHLENPDAVFPGFYLGYDFTQMLKTLAESRARTLLTTIGRASRQRKTSGGNPTPFPVYCEGWEFDILASKRLKIRPGCPVHFTACKCKNPHTWMYICDSGPFFQASLLSVINPVKWPEPIVSPAEYALLEQGKEARSTAVYGPETVAYNMLELDVNARLLRHLDTGFRAMGIKLKKTQWFGPGQAAQEWLSLQNLPTIKDLEPFSRYLNIARMTYYGGWFEIMAHGIIRGESWEYDINSAYPAIAATLPCMLHGTWTEGEGKPVRSGSDYTMVRAYVSGTNSRIGSMAHRHRDGRIARPHTTGGWYWYHELEAARSAGLVSSVHYLEWVNYSPCSCKPPLRGLAGLYDYRARIGKDTPAGKAAKLVYNSVYGKFAQSTGSPKYANAMYASLITAGTRCMILDAIATHPEGTKAVLMVATDGVYFTSPHPGLTLSGAMGDWSQETKHNLTLFKPGVYWSDETRVAIAEGKAPVFKARGIAAKDFAESIAMIDDIFASWSDARFPGTHEFPVVQFSSSFAMTTATQALARGKWETAGRLGHQDQQGTCDGCNGAHVVQSANPSTKRAPGGPPIDGIYWSAPHPGWTFEPEGAPYSKRFGLGPEPLDPDEFGVSPDGHTLDLLAEVFR